MLLDCVPLHLTRALLSTAFPAWPNPHPLFHISARDIDRGPHLLWAKPSARLSSAWRYEQTRASDELLLLHEDYIALSPPTVFHLVSNTLGTASRPCAARLGPSTCSGLHCWLGGMLSSLSFHGHDARSVVSPSDQFRSSKAKHIPKRSKHDRTKCSASRNRHPSFPGHPNHC